MVFIVGCVCPSGFQSVNTAHICSEPKGCLEDGHTSLKRFFFFSGIRKAGIVLFLLNPALSEYSFYTHLRSREVIWKTECTVGGQCLISLRAQAGFPSLETWTDPI